MKGLTIFANNLGIDLGTSKTIITDTEGNIILQEPSVVALDINTYEVLAVGNEAKNMTGKTPNNIVAIYPIEKGVIADFEITLAMLSYFLEKAVGGFTLFQPCCYVTVPGSLTDVERRTVEDVVLHAGARDCYLIEETVATVAGLNEDIFQPKGHLVLNMGAGTTEAAIVSLGGIITSCSHKTGGDDIDKSIYQFIRKKYNLIIGKISAETLKKSISLSKKGQLNEKEDLITEEQIKVFGRNVVTQMPEEISLAISDLQSLTDEVVDLAVDGVKTCLESVPPEIAEDILKQGILLVGGLSQMRGLDELISSRVGLSVMTVPQPDIITAIGIGKLAKRSKMKVLNGKL